MRYLFNDNWRFCLLEGDTELTDALAVLAQERFAPVPVPHDWLIADSMNLYRDGDGWYLKEFEPIRTDRQVLLTFDGIYMDSTVYVNGREAACNPYGYTSFSVDLTEHLREGSNQILVRVRYRAPNSRWYTGAGIGRNVWIRFLEPVDFAENGVYVSAAKCERGGDRNDNLPENKEITADYILHIEAELTGSGVQPDFALLDEAGEAASMELRSCERAAASEDAEPAESGRKCACRTRRYTMEYLCRDVKEWSAELPSLYRLEGRITENKPIGSTEGEALFTARIGFRTMEMRPQEGLFVNGRRVKLHGVCLHFDQGALGGAFNVSACRRQLRLMKEMGVNALRCAHAMPAPEFMDLADEMGFYVISEGFDMWERPKTKYDYARFFPAWHALDVERWICRDRNHPSLLMWSIGNEIYDTHADPERGAALTAELKALVEQWDPRGNGRITIGSNWMPWENAQHCADILKIAGYNYGEKYYEAHHAAHPDWVIYGSETSSIVQSRGIYHFPLSAKRLSDEDGQCSALGNSPTSWGAQSMERCVVIDRDLPYSMGQFLWSGIDYLGEPTPYHSKNSFFGQADTAGFPKDAYYVWQSAWTDPKTHPMIHIFPYWDHNPGQQVDVRVASNAAVVELFLNGKSLGRLNLTHAPGSGSRIIADYQLVYEPGILLAKGYDENGNCIAQEVKKSFGEAAALKLYAEQTSVICGSGELIYVTVTAVDTEGNPVENAAARIDVSADGCGLLTGLDNGDSTDYDSLKGTSKRLFSGKLLAIIAPAQEPGEIVITARSRGLKEAVLICYACPAQASSADAISVYPGERRFWAQPNQAREILNGKAGEIPVRAVRVIADSGNRLLTKDHPEAAAHVQILPANADDQEVIFSAVDDGGVPSALVRVEPAAETGAGTDVRLSALGDGTFRLRAASRSGTGQIRILSELEYRIEGVGKVQLDPYDFIWAGQYSSCEGEISPGNERGIATARDGVTVVTYENLDFGPGGSDRITMPVFTLTDEEYPIEIWQGRPQGTENRLLDCVVYQKKSLYNVYQEETWQLKERLRGRMTISFRVHQKMHIKGFSFQKQERVLRSIRAGEADRVYGDSYVRSGSDLTGIGNNVTLEFEDMKLDAVRRDGAVRIRLEGRTPQDVSEILLCLFSGGEETRAVLDFAKADDWTRRSFTVPAPAGVTRIAFLFLPGNVFDFRAFAFEKDPVSDPE
ncbi:MAG: DUF4982 domain-containing protein [Lachnospiraceae bacterium]|nr:DUF4982 domain-containing protein [Lachnospiraceae bacterium]